MNIEKVIIYPNQPNKIILEVGSMVDQETCITKLDVLHDSDHILVFENDSNKPSVAYARVPYAVFYNWEEK